MAPSAGLLRPPSGERARQALPPLLLPDRAAWSKRNQTSASGLAQQRVEIDAGDQRGRAFRLASMPQRPALERFLEAPNSRYR